MITIVVERQRSDAVRTEPMLLENNGRALWRLKGCRGEPDILLQGQFKYNILQYNQVYNFECNHVFKIHGTKFLQWPDIEGTWDAVSPYEKWFGYNADQVPAVEEYILSERLVYLDFWG